MHRLKSLVLPLLVVSSILFAYIYWYTSNRMIAPDAPAAVRGTVDLSEWNFASGGLVPLNGQWEFYGNRLLTPQDFEKSGSDRPVPTSYATVPAAWKPEGSSGAFGYGTFRLQIRLPAASDRTYGLVINNIKTAHLLFVNQERLGAGGRPGPTRADTRAANVPYVRFFESDGGTAQIVLQVANFSYAKGGITHPIYFGEQEKVLCYREYSIALDAIVGLAILILGGYFLVLFRLRTKETAWLLFGLSCLANAVYILTHGDKLIMLAFPGIPYEAFTKMQFISGILSEYFLLRYTWVFYRQYLRKPIMRAFEAILALRLLFVLATPVSIYSHWDNAYYLLSLALMCCVVYVMAIGASGKAENSVYMASSALFLLLINVGSFLNNIGVMEAYFMQPISFMGFMISQVLMLSRRFTHSFQTVEELSAKLRLLDKQKDEFLSHTSFELRMPLHGMIDIAESLIAGAAGKITEGQRDNLNLIVASGKRMANLVSDILDFAKLKNGEVVLSERPVDLRPLVRILFEMFRPLTLDKPVRLVDRLPEQLPPVIADEERLTQILYNLIGAAFKLTHQGEIALSAVSEHGAVTVRVESAGTGDEAFRQKEIIEELERGKDGFTLEYGGLGLGLSVTRRLVELHGGRIEVHSSPEQGTTIQFTLPAAREAVEDEREAQGRQAHALAEIAISAAAAAAAHETRNPAKESPAGAEYTILVADDDTATLQVMVNLLAMEGYSVLAATDGPEALRQLDRRRKIDLMIVDLMMPGVNGYEVCRAVRERYSLSELPVLILAARYRKEDMLAGLAAGANDFVGKPVEAEELRARVRTLLGMKRSASDLLRSEMDFLRAQIKPHFLFNTINTVISISHWDVEKAQQILTRLSSFLRESFDFDNREQMVPLARELELVKSYLFIEQARFGSRLRVEYDIDETIDVEVPPLILQPIVENAVRHGVTKRPEGGVVKVAVLPDSGSGAILAVEDDGPGIPPELRPAAGGSAGSPARKGVGLSNIDRRLRAHYGVGLEIFSVPGQGTNVTIRIPE